MVSKKSLIISAVLGVAGVGYFLTFPQTKPNLFIGEMKLAYGFLSQIQGQAAKNSDQMRNLVSEIESFKKDKGIASHILGLSLFTQRLRQYQADTKDQCGSLNLLNQYLAKDLLEVRPISNEEIFKSEYFSHVCSFADTVQKIGMNHSECAMQSNATVEQICGNQNRTPASVHQDSAKDW